jgi:hypothetical protein
MSKAVPIRSPRIAPARSMTFAALLLILCSIVTISRAPAAELPSCVENPQGGTRTSVVTGFPGQRLYVSPMHPRECSDTGIDACPGRAYLLTGDTVQTLGTCDEWTRVRYSGARSNTVGWVTSRRISRSAEYDIAPHIDLGPAEPERLSVALEPGVCEAALKGAVEDVGLRDVTRYSFAREVMRSRDHSEDYLPGFAQVIAEGSVDLFNEGKPKRVALLSVDYFARDQDYHTEWPVVLDANGLPDATIAMHRKLFESAGIADHVRLFRLHGVTYMEHEPISESGESSHEIWRFSRSEAVKVCEYTPTPSQR